MSGDRPSEVVDEVRDERGARPARILVVDDEDAVRALTTRILARGGFEVLEAVDPAHALELCGAAPTLPDLLLTDLVMPGMSGKELMDRLRPLAPGLPVLYLSGYTANVLDRYGLAEGEEVVSKPFRPAELLGAVQRVLARR